MKYILMHRELPVAILSINDISGTVYRVDDMLQPAHLPTGLYAADRKELAKNLNLWLAGRTIPASRSINISMPSCFTRLKESFVYGLEKASG